MPIRSELRHLYGRAHREYRAQLIAIHGLICMECGRETPRYLNAAHETHNPRAAGTVRLWCPSCHALHDAPHSFAMRRRSRARRVGQLWLLPEIEWAPYPAWEIPRRVVLAAQIEMFPRAYNGLPKPEKAVG